MDRTLRIYIGALILSMVGGMVALAAFDDGMTMPLGWVLVGVVAVATLLPPFHRAGAISAAAATATYGASHVARELSASDSNLGDAMVLVGIGGLTFAAISFISYGVARHAGRAQVRQQLQAWSGGQTPDRSELRHSYEIGRQLLLDEVARAERYGRGLTLVLVRPQGLAAGSHRDGAAGTESQLRELADFFHVGVRNVDRVIRHSDGVVAMLLPETPLEGAHLVAERLSDEAQKRFGAALHVGVAEFPEDALTAEELLAEAEGALEFAEVAGLQVASRILLSPPEPRAAASWAS